MFTFRNVRPVQSSSVQVWLQWVHHELWKILYCVPLHYFKRKHLKDLNMCSPKMSLFSFFLFTHSRNEHINMHSAHFSLVLYVFLNHETLFIIILRYLKNDFDLQRNWWNYSILHKRGLCDIIPKIGYQPSLITLTTFIHAKICLTQHTAMEAPRCLSREEMTAYLVQMLCVNLPYTTGRRLTERAGVGRGWSLGPRCAGARRRAGGPWAATRGGDRRWRSRLVFRRDLRVVEVLLALGMLRSPSETADRGQTNEDKQPRVLLE